MKDALSKLLKRPASERTLHLWHTSASHRLMWCQRAGISLEEAKALCPWSGADTERVGACGHRKRFAYHETCKPCQSALPVPLFECEKHEMCTPQHHTLHFIADDGTTNKAANCCVCPDWEPVNG